MKCQKCNEKLSFLGNYGTKEKPLCYDCSNGKEPVILEDKQTNNGYELIREKEADVFSKNSQGQNLEEIQRPLGKLILINGFFIITGIISLPFALMGILSFASASVGKANILAVIIISSLTFYPIVIILSTISSIGYYKARNYKIAVRLSLLPIINIAIFGPVIGFMVLGGKIYSIVIALKKLF